jgi:5-methylcytosine-specific restriction endonuclease McrA
MELLYKGVPKAARIWIGKCGSCGSVFKAQEKELGNIQQGDYRSDDEAWTRADCTVCGKKQDVLFHLVDSLSAKRVLGNLK